MKREEKMKARGGGDAKGGRIVKVTACGHQTEIVCTARVSISKWRSPRASFWALSSLQVQLNLN
jgi:hypothetical protein